ncbi:MAG: sugar phosphate isomerase/epimerase family protein [Clostridia bacterium]|jgi:xylose isomerase|nr:sugar phosphate isomerase/epimerase family protein [Spirochaetia bacterium]
MIKYSIILGNLGNTCDRFLSSGYKDQPSKDVMIKQAAAIPGVKAVELVGTWDVTSANADEIGSLLAKEGLACSSIIPDHFSQKRWGKGAFTSKDASIRAQALDETYAAAEIARKLKCPLVNLWPGQDGYDYAFQADYMKARGWIVEAVKKAAQAYPDIKFSLEYKVKEPRTHSFMARAADTLLIAKETGCANVGVTIDTGHALAGYENLAESAVILSDYGKKLFHMHFNDNYRSWDDDMIVGSVHFVEFVELMFWLKEIGYDSWYSMDQYPYREDGQGALRASVEFLQGIETMLDTIAMSELRDIISRGDPVESTKWIRGKLFRK